MKTFLFSILMVFFATLSFAGPINDPNAEVFRAAGCDAEWLKPVLSKDGTTVLYWQNNDGKGCDAQKTGGFRDDLERKKELAKR